MIDKETIGSIPLYVNKGKDITEFYQLTNRETVKQWLIDNILNKIQNNI